MSIKVDTSKSYVESGRVSSDLKVESIISPLCASRFNATLRVSTLRDRTVFSESNIMGNSGDGIDYQDVSRFLLDKFEELIHEGRYTIQYSSILALGETRKDYRRESEYVDMSVEEDAQAEVERTVVTSAIDKDGVSLEVTGVSEGLHDWEYDETYTIEWMLWDENGNDIEGGRFNLLGSMDHDDAVIHMSYLFGQRYDHRLNPVKVVEGVISHLERMAVNWFWEFVEDGETLESVYLNLYDEHDTWVDEGDMYKVWYDEDWRSLTHNEIVDCLEAGKFAGDPMDEDDKVDDGVPALRWHYNPTSVYGMGNYSPLMPAIDITYRYESALFDGDELEVLSEYTLSSKYNTRPNDDVCIELSSDETYVKFDLPRHYVDGTMLYWYMSGLMNAYNRGRVLEGQCGIIEASEQVTGMIKAEVSNRRVIIDAVPF